MNTYNQDLLSSMLFSTFERTNYDPISRQESSYEFLDRSAWKLSAWVRNKYEEFSRDYQPDEEFLKMFKSQSSKQHQSACFELLVFSLFKKAGFSCTRHPSTTTGKKPDFLVAGDGLSFYCECTLSGNSYTTEEERNRKSTVEDIIDNMDSFPYWVNLDYKVVSKKSISRRKLIKFITHIAGLNDNIPQEKLIDIPYCYNEDGWNIEITLLRKNKPEIKRNIGYLTEDFKVIDTVAPIITALNDKKASKYGLNENPYVICLNTMDTFTKESCFTQALFGQFESDNTITLYSNEQKGFFYHNGKPKNTSVSAVIIFRNFDLLSLTGASVTIWHNPFAKVKLPTEILPFTEKIFKHESSLLKGSSIQKTDNIISEFNIEKEEYLGYLSKTTS